MMHGGIDFGNGILLDGDTGNEIIESVLNCLPIKT